jgi:hypothetical protein
MQKLQEWAHSGGVYQSEIPTPNNFELMNWYKGTEDPQENIYNTVKGTGRPRIFLAHNGSIGLSILWIWYLEAWYIQEEMKKKTRDWGK